MGASGVCPAPPGLWDHHCGYLFMCFISVFWKEQAAILVFPRTCNSATLLVRGWTNPVTSQSNTVCLASKKVAKTSTHCRLRGIKAARSHCFPLLLFWFLGGRSLQAEIGLVCWGFFACFAFIPVDFWVEIQ